MITIHESLKGASIGWAVAPGALQPLLGHVAEVVFFRQVAKQRGLHPWLGYFQHIELNLSGSRAALGRSRAQVRDAGRVLSWLVSRFREALLDGSFWPALLPKRGKFWGSQDFLKVLKWNNVFRSPVFGWTCSGFTSVQHVLLHNCPELHFALSSLPCGPRFSFRSGAFTRLLPVRDHAHGHFKNASCKNQTSVAATTFALGLVA